MANSINNFKITIKYCHAIFGTNFHSITINCATTDGHNRDKKKNEKYIYKQKSFLLTKKGELNSF